MKYFNYIILFFIVLGLFDILRNRPLKTYHIYGEHNKDTIVFIHGLNDDNTSWYKQIPFFSKYYKCIVVNRTSLPKYLDYQDIYHIIKNNKSNGQLYCICASYGCEAAFKIQSNYNCFDKMVFMNYTWNPRYSYDYDCKYGIVYKFVYSGWFITNIINYYFKMFNILPVLLIQMLLMIPFERLGHLIEIIINKHNIYSDAFIGVKKVCSFTMTQRQSQASAYYKYANDIRYLMLNRDKVKPVKAFIPVLSLVGENDNIGHTNRGDLAKLMSEQNSKYELVKNGGHWFFQEQSEYINKKIYDFLN